MSEYGNYWCLEDILAEMEQVMVVARGTIPGLGFLDETTDSEDLQEGAQVSLPLWAALPLCQQGILNVKLPSFFGSNFRTNLAADPVVVNLADRCPYFYEMGSKVTQKYDKLIIIHIEENLGLESKSLGFHSRIALVEDSKQFSTCLNSIVHLDIKNFMQG
jgi:hypothetical protein